MANDLPPEARKLLAVAPEDFVSERQSLARELRDTGRREEATAIAAMRKPPPVVLAVNRAARDRPKAARAAADAAARVVKAQFGGEPDEYAEARKELDDALELLADVAIAQLSKGKSASDAVRRRVRDLLRSAVADETSREALAHGVLADEVEVAGFAPFAGLTPARKTSSKPSAAKEKRDAEKRRAEVKAAREELSRAEQELREAERAVREAERERSKAESEVASLQAKLDELR